MGTTLIAGADWIIGWDEGRGSHVYLQGADLAFREGEIIHVGRSFPGKVDRRIEGRGRLVMPGLVDIHSHPASEPLYKGYNEEARSARLGMSGLYEYMPVVRPDREGARWAAEYAYSEAMLSGVTTLVDLSVPWEGWLDLAGRSGLRVGIAPMYRSARWYTPNGFSVEYEWDVAAGEAALGEALALLEEAARSPEGRLIPVVSPSQIDTCTEGLLRESRAISDARGWPLTLHAAQSMVEFQEMTRRHGLTPIEWLEHLEFLGPRTTIAHAIFLDHHSWLRWPTRRDLDILALREASVAHCPNVFARGGIALESFSRYRDKGVNIGFGTDTFPLNLIEEMRWGAILGRVVDGDYRAGLTRDVFEAATVGGARILGRDDLGRLAPGARADIVLVDCNHPAMQPVRDPLRSLVFSAREQAITDVFVDGEPVVSEGAVLTLDRERAAAELAPAQARAFARAPELDWAGRDVETLSPLSLPRGEARASAP